MSSTESQSRGSGLNNPHLRIFPSNTDKDNNTPQTTENAVAAIRQLSRFFHESIEGLASYYIVYEGFDRKAAEKKALDDIQSAHSLNADTVKKIAKGLSLHAKKHPVP